MNPKRAIVIREFIYNDGSNTIHFECGDRVNLVQSSGDKFWTVTRDSDRILKDMLIPSSHIKIIESENDELEFQHQLKSRVSTTVSMPTYDRTTAPIMAPRHELKPITSGGVGGGTTANSEQSDDTSHQSSHESLDAIDQSPPNTINHCDSPEFAHLDAIEIKRNRFRKSSVPIYMNLPPYVDRMGEFDSGRQSRKLPRINNAEMNHQFFGDWVERYDENDRVFTSNSDDKRVPRKPPRRSTTRVDPNDVLAAQEQLNAAINSFSNHHYHLNNNNNNNNGNNLTDAVLDNDDRHSDTEVILNNRVQGIVKTFNNDDSLLSNLKRTPTLPKKELAPRMKRKPFHQNGGVDDMMLLENPLSIISNLLNNCPPGNWKRWRDPNTNEICFVSEKWFCKQDDMGRICFFEKSTTTTAPETNNTGDTTAIDGDTPKMRNHRDRDYFDEIDPKYAEQSRRLNHERSQRAHSIAMISPSDDSFAGIQIQGEFKHSRPFQDTNIAVPPPPNKLDAKDIILHDSLMHARTLIQGKQKRKHWSTITAVLTRHYLFFFKDQKNIHTPRMCEFTIGLLNAKVQWCSTESSKKNCFKIETFGNQTLFQDDDKTKSTRWFNTINDLINTTPQLLLHIPAPMAEDDFEFRRGVTRSNVKRPEDFSSQGSHTISGYTKFSQQSPNNKRKIRERLLNFLKKRPPVESLREKGIFKDENVFGCNLEQLCHRDNSKIPKFVLECVNAIEKNDIIADGIYRACGNLSTVQKLRFEINQDNYQGLWKETDVHVQTGLLKMFFREMKEPLLPFDRFEPLIKIITLENRDEKLEAFRNLVHNLPEENYQTLKFILKHLLKVESYSERNRMHIQNLAIVFGPTLLRAPNDLNNLIFDMMLQIQQSQVIEFFLQEYYAIFEF